MEYTIQYKTTHKVWYAMKTSYGRVLKAKEQLEKLKTECFVPMKYKKTKVNNRIKLQPTPAISNLIFIRADLQELEEAKKKIGFLHNMLIKSVKESVAQSNTNTNGNSKPQKGPSTQTKSITLEPIIIEEHLMTQFMQVLSDAKESIKFIDPFTTPLSKGTKVRITDGKYKGYEGVLIRPKGSRAKKIVIDINGIAYVEMPAVDVELVDII